MSLKVSRCISQDNKVQDQTFPYFLFQKETPSDVLLHLAAVRGDDKKLSSLLDSGRVHVDSQDEVRKD